MHFRIAVYELKIRGCIKATMVDRMRLKSLTNVKLQTGLTVCGLEDYGAEIQVFKAKIVSLTVDLEAFQGTSAEVNKIRAQLVHTFGQVNRLHLGEPPKEKEATYAKIL